MSPPAKTPGVKTSTTVEATPPKVDTKTTTTAPAAENEDPKVWVPSATLGLGVGAAGGRNGGNFAIDAQSDYNDYFHLQLNGTLMRDIVGNKVRFRIGPRLDINHTQGNENTGGSRYTQFTGGAQFELDWVRAYGDGLWGVIKGPSYVNLHAGIGYGFGVGTAETFSLQDQSGFATNFGAGLNVVNFNVKNLQIGLDFLFNTTAIYGSDHNSSGNWFGGGITFRPGTNKKVVQLPPPDRQCKDTKEAVNDYIAKNAKLRSDNTKVKEDLDTLKSLLEKGKNPLTTSKIRDALYYREIRLSIIKALPSVDETKVRDAVRAAFKTNDEKKGDAILMKIPGMTQEILTGAKEAATKKYPQGYDYWAQVSGDPVPTNVPDPLPTDCDDQDKLLRELAREHGDLRDRNAGLKGRFDTAVLLDALDGALGEDLTKFVEVYKATILDVVQPNFNTARPNADDIKRLEEFVAKKKGQTVQPDDAELLKIMKPVHANSAWESKNLWKIAGQINGTQPLPGEEWAAEDAKKAGKPVPPPEREWIKNLKFLIEGHTDGEGSVESNQGLSERRAKWVTLILTLHGVDASRLRSVGYGELRQAVPEDGLRGKALSDGRVKNRRIEFRIDGAVDPSSGEAFTPGDKDPQSPKIGDDGNPLPEKDKKPKTEKKPVKKDNPPPPPPPKDTQKPPVVDFGDDKKPK